MKDSFDKCGEPAFDNIEDLLTEKIIDHSKKFSDSSKKEDEKKREVYPKHIHCICKKKKILIIILFFLSAFLATIIFKGRFFKKR